MAEVELKGIGPASAAASGSNTTPPDSPYGPLADSPKAVTPMVVVTDAAMSSSSGGGSDAVIDYTALEDHQLPEDERLGPLISGPDAPCGCLKRWCTPKSLLAVLCFFVFSQTMIVGGLLGAVISSLEKRYNLNSTQTGLLPAINDFGFLMFSGAVGVYGQTTHKPKWLGKALMCTAAGALVFVIPQMYGGKYEATTTTGSQALCGDAQSCATSPGPNNGAYVLFCFAMLFFAGGGSSLWILSPPYITEIAPAANQTTYLATFYAVAALGPAIGFGLAGVVLGSWVDVGTKPPEGLTPKDSDWVGAWWAAFVTGALIALVAVPWFFLFPKFPPGTKHMTQRDIGAGKRKSVVEPPAGGAAADALAMREDAVAKPDSDMYEEPIGFAAVNARRKSMEEAAVAAERARRASLANGGQDMPPIPGVLATPFSVSLKQCVSNVPFMLGTFAETTDGFIVAGFSTFLPKIVQNMYSVPASTASFSVGAVVIPGAAGGIFLGGYLCDRFRWNTKRKALFAAITPTISLVFLLCFAIICVSNPLAGANVRYNPENNDNALVPGVSSRTSVYAPCNSACGCLQTTFTPVCDTNGITYFSACMAGCTVTHTDPNDAAKVLSYSNCTCASRAPASITPAELATLTVVPGKCDVGCNALGVFLFLLFIAMLTTFLNSSPTTAIRFAVLPPNQKSFGSAFSGAITRAVGTIPGPLIFGAAIDSVCSSWLYAGCGSDAGTGARGTCNEFNNESLRVRFLALSLVPRFIGVVLYTLRYLSLPDPNAGAVGSAPQRSASKA